MNPSNHVAHANKFHFDDELRKSTRQAIGVEGKYVVGYVGRLYDGQKNLYRLLDMFSVVARKRQGAVLVMVGDGPDKVELEEKIRHVLLSVSIICINQLTLALDLVKHNLALVVIFDLLYLICLIPAIEEWDIYGYLMLQIIQLLCVVIGKYYFIKRKIRKCRLVDANQASEGVNDV